MGHKRKKRKRALQVVHSNCAGIDVGKREHYVAVEEGAEERPVRRFGSFTDELRAMASWLGSCGVETVAMEATGVYWIPVYEVLDRAGLEVYLVDARATKQVSGRKSGRAGLSVDPSVDELWAASRRVPPVGRDLRAALLRAPASSIDAGSGALRTAHAEGVDADERAVGHGAERSCGQDGAGDPARHGGRRTRRDRASAVARPAREGRRGDDRAQSGGHLARGALVRPGAGA